MKPLIRLSFITVLFGLLASPCQAQSEQTGGSPLKVELSISHYQAVKKPVVKSDQPPLPLEVVEIPEQNSRIRVLTGEPLILNYCITNTSSEPITITLGSDKHPWVVPSIKNEEGLVLPPIPFWRQSIPDSGFCVVPLLPGGHYEGLLILTRYFNLHVAGRYKLSLQMTIPWFIGSHDESEVRYKLAEYTVFTMPEGSVHWFL